MENTKNWKVIEDKIGVDIAQLPYALYAKSRYNLDVKEGLLYSFFWTFLSDRSIIMKLTDKEIGEVLNMKEKEVAIP